MAGWQLMENQKVFFEVQDNQFKIQVLSSDFLLSIIEGKSEEENLPSMETLEISKKNTIQSISSHFGGEEEEDIPDMEEYEDPDNLIETDPVRCLIVFICNVLLYKMMQRLDAVSISLR